MQRESTFLVVGVAPRDAVVSVQTAGSDLSVYFVEPLFPRRTHRSNVGGFVEPNEMSLRARLQSTKPLQGFCARVEEDLILYEEVRHP